MLILILILIKCKFHPRTGHEGTDGSKNSSIISSTSALDEVGGSAPRPGPFNPRKETRYPLYWGAPVPVWTGAENLAYTGIRSPDRPVRSELLYQLRYPGPSRIRSLHYCVSEKPRIFQTHEIGVKGVVAIIQNDGFCTN